MAEIIGLETSRRVNTFRKLVAHGENIVLADSE